MCSTLYEVRQFGTLMISPSLVSDASTLSSWYYLSVVLYVVDYTSLTHSLTLSIDGNSIMHTNTYSLLMGGCESERVTRVSFSHSPWYALNVSTKHQRHIYIYAPIALAIGQQRRRRRTADSIVYANFTAEHVRDNI